MPAASITVVCPHRAIHGALAITSRHVTPAAISRDTGRSHKRKRARAAARVSRGRAINTTNRSHTSVGARPHVPEVGGAIVAADDVDGAGSVDHGRVPSSASPRRAGRAASPHGACGTHTNPHAHTRTHTRTHARNRTRTRTRMHARTHARTHSHAHAFTHTHTHTLARRRTHSRLPARAPSHSAHKNTTVRRQHGVARCTRTEPTVCMCC